MLATPLGELRAAVADFEAADFGLGEPRDPELALAGVTALSRLALEPGRAAALHDVLAGVAEAFDARPDPDLALALAQGWSALLVTPHGAGLPAGERAAGLDAALRAAEAIDVPDGRDAFGVSLAQALHHALRAAGRGAEAVPALERALERFAAGGPARPWLLAALADEERVSGTWGRAWARLREAEALAAASAAPDPRLARNLAAVRCQLELACGLHERAAFSLAAEREAAARAGDDASRLSVLLDGAGLALATLQPAALRREIGLIGEALADERAFAALPGARAQLLARRALLAHYAEELDPEVERYAERWLADAFAADGLDPDARVSVGLRRIARALAAGDLAAAGERLAAVEALARERAPQAELADALVAQRALVALARGAPRAELEAREREARDAYGRFLARLAASPQRPGGFGWLAWSHRRALQAALVELSLALDPERGAERALALALQEDALGSLARRLGCQTGAAAGDVAAIRARLLHPGVGLLAFLPGARGLRLACVDAEGVVSVPIEWGREPESLAREIVGALASSPHPLAKDVRAARLAELEAAAAALAERLLPEAARARIAGWEGAYVAGAELVGGVPLELLPVGGEALGRRLALAYLPSLAVGLELARRAPGAQGAEGNLLLVAAPELAAAARAARPELVDFRLDRAQRTALTAGFPRATVLVGKDASRARLLEALAKERPAVLHLLVHGASDPERELPGALALAPDGAGDDGLLWCEELFELDLDGPPLVLLSSCGSARGPRRAGDDGIAHLRGAFLSRGSLCVVEAAADVALEPTVALTGALGRALARGRPPAFALLDARAELARDAAFAHPFYAYSLRATGLGFGPVASAGGPR